MSKVALYMSMSVDGFITARTTEWITDPASTESGCTTGCVVSNRPVDMRVGVVFPQAELACASDPMTVGTPDRQLPQAFSRFRLSSMRSNTAAIVSISSLDN